MMWRRIELGAAGESEVVAYLCGERAHQSQHNDFSFILTHNGPVSSSAFWMGLVIEH